jgi:hypothetical protein
MKAKKQAIPRVVDITYKNDAISAWSGKKKEYKNSTGVEFLRQKFSENFHKTISCFFDRCFENL